MTIAEAIKTVSMYPIPVEAIERFCIDRELEPSTEYTKPIGDSQSFLLALADAFYYLATAPDLTEQNVGINSHPEIKKRLLKDANAIYDKFDDPKFTGFDYGFVGESYNG